MISNYIRARPDGHGERRADGRREEENAMKAAYIESTGGPEMIRYGDVPTPSPAQGEVLVRVVAAALNPVDLYIRAGTVAMPLPKPFISGCDLAGVIEAVGPHVRRFAVGERVWGSNQGLLGRQGTSADYVCSSEEWLYPLPSGVSEQAAAAGALTGITAHLGLFRACNLQRGETVFVNGGTGGVGSMVVQMAKAVGAKVVTTVGNKAKEEMCRNWGADCVLNYKSDDIVARVREFTGGKGVEVWYETQREPDLTRIVDLMAQRGRIVLIAGRQARPQFPVGPFYVKGLSLYGFAMFNATADEQRRCADDINRWLSEGKLKPPIGKVFKLSEAAQAHRFLEENTLGGAGTLAGKILLVP
jgi:NADPH2:quinone reductase